MRRLRKKFRPNRTEGRPVGEMNSPQGEGRAVLALELRRSLQFCRGPPVVMIEIMRPRARASRDITVPIGTPVTSAISR